MIEVKRKAEFLDKYAERTESGDLERELIGVYFNYNLKLGPSTNPEEYDRLWEKLSEAKEFHTVSVPYGANQTYTFTAYFSNVADEMLCRNSRNNWHKQKFTVYEDVRQDDGQTVAHNMGTFYLSDWENSSDTLANFTATDAVGLLDSAPHEGGLYDTTAAQLAADILAGYDYELEEALRGVTVRG